MPQIIKSGGLQQKNIRYLYSYNANMSYDLLACHYIGDLRGKQVHWFLMSSSIELDFTSAGRVSLTVSLTVDLP